MILLIKILLPILFLSSENSLDKYLAAKLKEYTKFKYEIIAPKNIELNSIIPDESREFKYENGYGYVPIKFRQNTNSLKHGVLTLKLKLFQKVLVTSKEISRNEEFSYSNLVETEEEITNIYSKPITDLKLAKNYKAKIKIGSDTILQEYMIIKIPDIERNERLTAIYENGNVNISFFAVARTDGSIGDIIKIKDDNNKIFKAKILNKNQVKIIE